MYVPNPIRCRTCLKFGHFTDKCPKQIKICDYCSKPAHNGQACDSIVPTCVNCGNHHSSLDVNCPRLIEEKEIKIIQFKEKIPYSAARRKYKENHPNISNKSFAEVTKYTRKVGVDTSTQTDAFIYENNCTKVINTSSSKGLMTESALSRPPLLIPSLPAPSPPPTPVSPSTPPPSRSPPHSFPPGERTISNPRSHSPRNSRSNDPQPLNEELNSDTQFKVPLQPRRNSQNKRNKKNNKNKEEQSKSGDEMETT